MAMNTHNSPTPTTTLASGVTKLTRPLVTKKHSSWKRCQCTITREEILSSQRLLLPGLLLPLFSLSYTLASQAGLLEQAIIRRTQDSLGGPLAPAGSSSSIQPIRLSVCVPSSKMYIVVGPTWTFSLFSRVWCSTGTGPRRGMLTRGNQGKTRRVVLDRCMYAWQLWSKIRGTQGNVR
jgi:hypothetical protein